MRSRTPAIASAALHKSSELSASKIPRSRYFAYFSIAAIGCGIDLCTKHVVFAWRGMPQAQGEWWIWKNLLGIETALNHGALFGIGQGRSGLFSLLSVVAAVGIVYWLFVAKAARDWFLTIALALVTGGILGNLYDRLGFWGGRNAEGNPIFAVRDWILIAYGGLDLPVLGQRWPNFNIADSLLVCGAGLLVWHAFTAKEPSVASADELPAKSPNNN